ncbi:hypothetical protein FA13DRAFT_879461 [Coprinellus micaceus]|uniref:Uncharacterized protein n=1 Tax=Coprinellus micaceus TaxID=71717 RepID=A0A4Y7S0B3_COPMI|nr:hypothetical protein FA13DRAFT_879461 [Coprinellus micaceus]
MGTPATATTTESMAEGEWYASRPTPPQLGVAPASPTTATRSDSDRYPRPHPLDPFAPLRALRDTSRSASMDSGQRRPWMVEASSSPWAMTTPGSPDSSLGEGSACSQNPSRAAVTSGCASPSSTSPSPASACCSSKQGKSPPPERRPSTATGVIRSCPSSDQGYLVDGSLYAKPAVPKKDADRLSRLPSPTSRSPASQSRSRMSYIGRQSVSPTRSLESSASGHCRFPTSTAPPVVTKAVTDGDLRYPTPNPLDPFAPLSALRSMSLNGRKRPTWAVDAGSPVSPATSASSSLPRTPTPSDGACPMQRPSTASSIPTSFRSPVSTPASSFKHGYHRPAVVRPMTMEACSSTWASSANTVILPDEMGNLQQPPEGKVSTTVLPTDSHVTIQDQNSIPAVGPKDSPPPKLKRQPTFLSFFLGLKRPSTSFWGAGR